MEFDEFFERRGYNAGGVKIPSPDLHVVNPDQKSFIDELRDAGVLILPEDIIRLQHPDDPSPFTESTISDYRRLLNEARARQALIQLPNDAITPTTDLQQTA